MAVANEVKLGSYCRADMLPQGYTDTLPTYTHYRVALFLKRPALWRKKLTGPK